MGAPLASAVQLKTEYAAGERSAIGKGETQAEILCATILAASACQATFRTEPIAAMRILFDSRAPI